MRKIYLLLSVLLANNAYAIFCPTNFVAIDFGATLAQVLEQCGKPTEIKQFQSYGNTAQEWTFFVKPNGYQNLTVKMTVLFSNNQVANITIDDENQSTAALCQTNNFGNMSQTNCNVQQKTIQSLSSTQVCGFPIKIGDSMQTVQGACGKPVMTQYVQKDNPNDASMQDMTQMIYAGPPKVMLTFQNGHLKDRTFI